MRLLFAATLTYVVCANARAAPAGDPWIATTNNDLAAVHDLLEDNHPGPVDAQNPAFKEWLESGLHQAEQRANGAKSLEDYQRALRFYANGFHDGHIGVGFHYNPRDDEWPGFVAGTTSAGVAFAEADAGVQQGATLISCDGQSVDALLAARADPYFWNAEIPHQRYERAYHLFY